PGRPPGYPHRPPRVPEPAAGARPSGSGRLRKRTPATPPAGPRPSARLPASVAPQPEQREEDAQRGGDDQHRLAPDRQVDRHTGEGQREIVPARGRPSAHAVTPR